MALDPSDRQQPPTRELAPVDPTQETEVRDEGAAPVADPGTGSEGPAEAAADPAGDPSGDPAEEPAEDPAEAKTGWIDPVDALGVARRAATSHAEANRDPDLDALRDVTFATVWRGYDPHAVDAYVDEVERALDRFELRTSPTEAVRRALDRVGEQTAAILRQAEQSAEEMTASSRARADERLQQAEREAAELRAEAEARVRGLDDDIERLWQERQRLIDATRSLAGQLVSAANSAEARFPPADMHLPGGDAGARGGG